jgi:hypothetical protein
VLRPHGGQRADLLGRRSRFPRVFSFKRWVTKTVTRVTRFVREASRAGTEPALTRCPSRPTERWAEALDPTFDRILRSAHGNREPVIRVSRDVRRTLAAFILALVLVVPAGCGGDDNGGGGGGGTNTTQTDDSGY